MKPTYFKAGGVVAAIALVALIAASNPRNADSTGPRPATKQEVDEFAQLVLRADRAIVDADVTGDPSAFPEVFYNDATVKLHNEYYDVLARVDTRDVESALRSAVPGPSGDATGLLTAYTAIVLDNERNRAAWEAIEERAAAEDRTPSVEDMPNGEVPRPRPSGSSFGNASRSLYAVVVDGKHATAWVAYEDLTGQPADYKPDPATRYVFTNVDGHWYVTNLETVPGPNVPIGERP